MIDQTKRAIQDFVDVDILTAHARSRVSERMMANATSHAKRQDTVGDHRVQVFVVVVDREISDISYIGFGCNMMRASASLMCELIKRRNLCMAESCIREFTSAVKTRSPCTIKELFPLLRGTNVLGRSECVLLPWQALEDALVSERRKAV